MSVEVVVTGIGLVSALGTLETTWKQILAGGSGVRRHQPFSELKPRPLALIGNSPADLLALTRQAIAEALQDAGLSGPLPDCGVVIGSSRGYQARLEQFAREQLAPDLTDELLRVNPADPHLFPTPLAQWPSFLPHAAAIAAAQEIGSTGPVLAPMAACATGIWAIAQAFELIQTGQCQRVMTGGVEAAITPLTLAGFQQMGALATTGAYPFDRQREGFVLGEGAAVFVLETAALARRRNAKIYGQVLGFGLTNDAYAPTAPEMGGKSALAAIQQALDRSCLSAAEIDYIHAHGTGTQLNDRHEALLIQSLFPPGVAVSSTKGATGHTLGASGALGVAFSLMSMKEQLLPPCIGLRESEFELNLVRVASLGEIQKVLCFSFGFGGQNGVIALGKR
ncbi:MAG: beta-ketoacyl-ACP synthase [Actinomycetota bacterium]